MKLRDIVVEPAIIPQLESTERDAAVAELLDALVEADAVEASRRDEFYAAIIDREKRASTGLGHGVAVPHVKHDDVEELKVAIGLSPQGVEFNSLDRKPVHSIFLLLSPAERPEEHLDAMQLIFSSLSQDTFRRFLRQAKTVDDVLTLLREADEKQLVR